MDMTATVSPIDPTRRNSDRDIIAAAEVPFPPPEERKRSWLGWGGPAPKLAQMTSSIFNIKYIAQNNKAIYVPVPIRVGFLVS